MSCSDGEPIPPVYKPKEVRETPLTGREVRALVTRTSLGLIATLTTLWGGGVLVADVNDQRLDELRPNTSITGVVIQSGAKLRDDRFSGIGGLFLAAPSWTDRRIPDGPNGSEGAITIDTPDGVQVFDGGTYRAYDPDGILQVYQRDWYALPTDNIIEALEEMNGDGRYDHVLGGLRHDRDGITNVASDLATTIPPTITGGAQLTHTWMSGDDLGWDGAPAKITSN